MKFNTELLSMMFNKVSIKAHHFAILLPLYKKNEQVAKMMAGIRSFQSLGIALYNHDSDIQTTRKDEILFILNFSLKLDAVFGPFRERSE